MIFDPLYFIILAPTLLLSFWASWKTSHNFKKYGKIATRSGMTGAQAAAVVLRSAGIENDVDIERVGGFLSDHYDPSKKVLRLSPDVYDSNSISAVGVAAHEAGHAIQDATNYSMLGLRTALVPTVGIGSNFSYIIIFIGFILSMKALILAGIALFSLVVIFQLVTLPVEIDASNRAKRLLWETGVLSDQTERAGVAKVLNAAAWTYVAAAASSIATLLYFLIRAGFLGRSDD